MGSTNIMCALTVTASGIVLILLLVFKEGSAKGHISKKEFPTNKEIFYVCHQPKECLVDGQQVMLVWVDQQILKP